MPLQPGNSRSVIESNIHELTVNGSRKRSHDQIVAIALANADRHPRRALGGIGTAVHQPKFTVKPPISPSQGSPWWTRSAEHEMTASPHGIGHFAAGGVMSASEGSPWWERSDARIMDQPHFGGLITGGSAGGRTDQLPLSVPSGSHILPADTVSGMGQGSSAAGAKLFMQSIRTGPYGVSPPAEIHGHGPPAAPHVANPATAAPLTGLAHGGNVHTPKTSILAAADEVNVPLEDWIARDPDDGKFYWHRGVKSIGGGDEKRGHDLLDHMIKKVREFNIKWLKSAPAPKR